MKNYLFLLAATALLGQTHRVTAQTTASSQGQTLDHLFSTVIRSSDVNPSAARTYLSSAGTNLSATGANLSSAGANLPSGQATGKAIPMSQSDLRRCCEKISKDIQRVYFLKDRNGKMRLQVRGVYTHGAALFFWLQVNNRSPLDYEVDSIAFLITAAGGKQSSSSRSKTASSKADPPKIVTPVYVSDSTLVSNVPRATIPGHSRVTGIFVLPRFTLPPGRQLTIYLGEKNGGRQLQIRAGNWTLERARPV